MAAFPPGTGVDASDANGGDTDWPQTDAKGDEKQEAAPSPDAGLDADDEEAPDATVDAQEDVQEAGEDALPEAEPDVLPDVAEDVTGDVTVDAQEDAPLDALQDVIADVLQDVVDAAPEADADADAGLVTCLAGSGNTADNLDFGSTTSMGVLLHFWNGQEQFQRATPVELQFLNQPLPGHMAFGAQSVASGKLLQGFTTVSATYYQVQQSSLTSVVECVGADVKTEGCLIIVAKSFRCQRPYYNENSGCPDPALTFTKLGDFGYFSRNFSGYGAFVAEILCQ